MKPGSLIVPIIDFAKIMPNFPEYSCEPFLPNKDTICTCQSIIREGKAIHIEEVKGNKKTIFGKLECPFDISYWREISPPEENSAQEIVNEVIQESLTQPV